VVEAHPRPPSLDDELYGIVLVDHGSDDDVRQTLGTRDDLPRLVRRDQHETARLQRDLLRADADHAAALDRDVDLFLA
jgi:hypothetical protein